MFDIFFRAVFFSLFWPKESGETVDWGGLVVCLFFCSRIRGPKEVVGHLEIGVVWMGG